MSAHLALEGILIVPHAHDPICRLAIDLPCLSILTPKHNLGLCLIIWEGKHVLHQPAFTTALLSCGWS